MALSGDGQTKGWMMNGAGGWADFLEANSSGPVADDPVVLEVYQHGGNGYFKVKGTSDTYLSVSGEGQVGFFGWDGASTFHKADRRLFSDYNGEPLRLRTGDRAGELWCGHEGGLLEVAYTPV